MGRQPIGSTGPNKNEKAGNRAVTRPRQSPAHCAGECRPIGGLMANTRSTTTVIPWRLGFTGARPAQSTPGLQNCQGRRWKASVRLPPYGGEVFLPLLDPYRVYEITVEGTC